MPQCVQAVAVAMEGKIGKEKMTMTVSTTVKNVAMETVETEAVAVKTVKTVEGKMGEEKTTLTVKLSTTVKTSMIDDKEVDQGDEREEDVSGDEIQGEGDLEEEALGGGTLQPAREMAREISQGDGQGDGRIRRETAV